MFWSNYVFVFFNHHSCCFFLHPSIQSSNPGILDLWCLHRKAKRDSGQPRQRRLPKTLGSLNTLSAMMLFESCRNPVVGLCKFRLAGTLQRSSNIFKQSHLIGIWLAFGATSPARHQTIRFTLAEQRRQCRPMSMQVWRCDNVILCYTMLCH